jgi:cytosine deaminase
MGIEAGMIRVGALADLIAFRARGLTEWMSRPQSDRIVLRAGQVLDATPPDHRELDALLRLPG